VRSGRAAATRTTCPWVGVGEARRQTSDTRARQPHLPTLFAILQSHCGQLTRSCITVLAPAFAGHRRHRLAPPSPHTIARRANWPPGHPAPQQPPPTTCEPRLPTANGAIHIRPALVGAEHGKVRLGGEGVVQSARGLPSIHAPRAPGRGVGHARLLVPSQPFFFSPPHLHPSPRTRAHANTTACPPSAPSPSPCRSMRKPAAWRRPPRRRPPAPPQQ